MSLFALGFGPGIPCCLGGQTTNDGKHQNTCIRDLTPLLFLCYIEYDEFNNEFYHVPNTRTKHGLIHSPSKVSFSLHFLPTSRGVRKHSVSRIEK